MPEITRSSILNNIKEELGIQGMDIPKNAQGVSLVYPVNAKYATVVRSGLKSTTGTVTIYTAPSTKDFFITSIFLSYSKDITCDGTTVVAQITQDGVLRNIITLPILVGSVVQNYICVTFQYPVKVDKGGTFAIGCTFTAGAITSYGSVTGFILE
jgi:hypothetical protein